MSRVTLSCLTLQQKLASGARDNILRKERSWVGYQCPFDPLMLSKVARMFLKVGEFGGWIRVASEGQSL